MSTVLHVGHSVHSGTDIFYEFALNLGPQFWNLPNLYGISVIEFDGTGDKVVATILVKTDLGTSKDDVGTIYAWSREHFSALKSLPTKNVKLRCTKANLALGVIPDEQLIEQMLRDIYLRNSTSGSA